jgi:hypothetical protein
MLLLFNQAAAGNYVVNGGAGAFTFAGQDATLTYTPAGGYTLPADVGLFSFAGQNASFLYARQLNGNAGAFSFVGQDALFLRTRSLASNAGAFNVAGQNADLIYSGGPPPVVFVDWILFSRRKRRR